MVPNTYFSVKKNIEMLHTVPYRHEMNGACERLNRTLIDKARTIFPQSGMDKKYLAIQCTAYLVAPLRKIPKYR